MAKSLVICENCGVEFLKENHQIKIKKNHFCCYECSNLFKIIDNLSKSIGKKYGQLTVLSLAFRKDSCSYVNCLCDCGNTCVRKLCRLNREIVKTCGKCPVKFKLMKHIKIIDSNTWIWTSSTSKFGYGQFRYKGNTCLAHRMVYELFIGEIPNGMCVLHKDDNPPNVCPSNLFLGTRKDNNLDKVKKGRSNKGEKSYLSKLTNKKVIKIRELYNTGKYTQKEIGEMFSISGNSVSTIVNYKVWTHVSRVIIY